MAELTREVKVGTKIWDKELRSRAYEVTGVAKNGIFTRKTHHHPDGSGHSFIKWENTHNLEICK